MGMGIEFNSNSNATGNNTFDMEISSPNPSTPSTDYLSMANNRHLEILQELNHQQIEKYYYNLREYTSLYNKDKFHNRTRIIPTPSNRQYYSLIVSKLATLAIKSSPLLSPSSTSLKSINVTIPIRLEIETEGYRLFDCFLWNQTLPLSFFSSSTFNPSFTSLFNASSNIITIEEFAQITCMDFDIPPSIFHALICKSIKDQILEYLDYLKTLAEVESKTIMKGWTGLIRLDIIIGLLHLTDQFEWSLEGEEDYYYSNQIQDSNLQSNHSNQIQNSNNFITSPEAFTEIYSKELALPPEFTPLIIHNIREQVYLIKRAFITIMDPEDPDLSPFINYYNYKNSNSERNIKKTRRNNDDSIINHDDNYEKNKNSDIMTTTTIMNCNSNTNGNSNNNNNTNGSNGSSNNPSIPFSSLLLKRENSKLQEFTPTLIELDIQDLEKMEQNREREARRKRRQQAKPNNLQSNINSGIGSGIEQGTGSLFSRKSIIANTIFNTGNVNMNNENILNLINSPPKTLCTPLSYRGTLHRHNSANSASNVNNISSNNNSVNSSVNSNNLYSSTKGTIPMGVRNDAIGMMGMEEGEGIISSHNNFFNLNNSSLSANMSTFISNSNYSNMNIGNDKNDINIIHENSINNFNVNYGDRSNKSSTPITATNTRGRRKKMQK